jgi:hypothetical protein
VGSNLFFVRISKVYLKGLHNLDSVWTTVLVLTTDWVVVAVIDVDAVAGDGNPNGIHRRFNPVRCGMGS